MRTVRSPRFLVWIACVLTLAATVLGIGFAVAALQVIVALAPADIPRLAEASLDGRVLAATIGVSALAAIGFGLFPMVQAGAPIFKQHSAGSAARLRAAGGSSCTRRWSSPNWRWPCCWCAAQPC